MSIFVHIASRRAEMIVTILLLGLYFTALSPGQLPYASRPGLAVWGWAFCTESDSDHLGGGISSGTTHQRFITVASCNLYTKVQVPRLGQWNYIIYSFLSTRFCTDFYAGGWSLFIVQYFAILGVCFPGNPPPPQIINKCRCGWHFRSIMKAVAVGETDTGGDKKENLRT